jgi:hypothetical protein
MKITNHGETATITLTAREAQIVRMGDVPLIYAPGGMGPGEVTFQMAQTGGMVRFGGACYVNTEENLRACLIKFEAAVSGKIAQQDAAYLASQDEEAGAQAYRSPDSATKRCPYRRPERIAAWRKGFDRQHAERFA